MSIELHTTISQEIAHNAHLKSYPDGSIEITCSPRAIFRESGWEAADKWKPESRSGSASPVSSDADNLARSVRRARSKLRDYARSNQFAYFVTLTLSPDLAADRYDIGTTVKQIRSWLDNRCRRYGLIYVLVPEHHKDGAIHFHGFINAALPVVDSGTISNGGKPRRPRSERQRADLLASGWHVVYNLPDWKFGFSTAIKLYGDREKAIGYVCKYVGKEMSANGGKIGGRWYYSGGALQRPSVSACDLDYDQLAADHPGCCWAVDGFEFCRVYIGPDSQQGGGISPEV